ncbi:hypothetical protein GGI35DRAFT_5287 [Trichoderma velutinum]
MESSSRHQVAPPSLKVSLCLLHVPSAFPHHHLPLARAQSPDRSPFCLSPFVPVAAADSIGSSSPKKEAVFGLGVFLLSLFDCAIEATTTTDIPRRATTISLTRKRTRARARTSAQPNPIAVLFEHQIVIGYTTVGRLRNILPGTLDLIPSPRRTS